MSESNFRLKRLDGYRRAYCMLKEVNWLIFDLALFGELARGQDERRDPVWRRATSAVMNRSKFVVCLSFA